MRRISSLLLIAFLVVSTLSNRFINVYAINNVLNNGAIKFVDSMNGTTTAINSKGTLNQPFYYNGSNWYKLTYSRYPLNYAIAEGAGTNDTNEWNYAGTILQDQNLTNLVIDDSGLTVSGSSAYGVLKSSGTFTINSKTIFIENTYTLQQGKNFVQIKTKFTNTSQSSLTNFRYWVGTQDDWVGTSDGPTKTKGNIVNGVFTSIASQTERAHAIQIVSGSEGVLFYTENSGANMVVDYCCSFSNSTSKDPCSSNIQTYGDGSYAMYIRLNDLAPQASQEVVWYYAAGSTAQLANIVSDVAAAAGGGFQNVTYSSAGTSYTSTNTATGFYILVPSSSSTFTASDIKTRATTLSDAAASRGSVSMSANVASNISLTGLTQGTSYDLWFVTEYTDNTQNPAVQVFTTPSKSVLTTTAYSAPIISATTAASSISSSGATLGGTITADGMDSTGAVSDRGVCYALTSNPAVGSSTCVSMGTGTGSFSGAVTGLNPATTYYIRSYAINSVGTSYGTQTSFTTSSIVLNTNLDLSSPQIGAQQLSSFSGTGYTATVVWSPAETDGVFHAGTPYTATITLTPNTGYTLTGIASNSFTLPNATVTHSANSGSITAYYASIARKTLTYASNGGSSITGGLVTVGDVITQPTDPSRVGYLFRGWYSDATFNDLFSFSTVMPNMDLTLYAKWDLETYTLTYDYAGGTGSNPSSYTVLDTIAFGTPTKEGYRFTGWTENGASISGLNSGSIGSKSLVANWVFDPRDPVLGNLTLLGLDADSAQLKGSISDWGNPKLTSFRYELTNTTDGSSVSQSLGSDLSINLISLKAYSTYSIRILASNGTKTLISNSVEFMPKLKDQDNDGIPDVRDAYPTDSTKSMDMTEINPDKEPARALIGEKPSDTATEYQLRISEADLMGLDRTDNILVVMGTVQFVIPVAMVDSIIANTGDPDAYLTLRVEPQINDAQISPDLLSSEGMDLVEAYDYRLFQIYPDGKEEAIHQLGGKIKVGIGLDQLKGEFDPTKMEVYYYNTDTGTIESMKAAYDPVNRSLVFMTEHFSYYVIGVKKGDNPTSTAMKLIGLGIALGLTLFGLILWIFKRRKKQEAY